LAFIDVDASNRYPPSTPLLTLLNGVPWLNFSKFAVAHAKMGHVSPTMPLLGVICYFVTIPWYQNAISSGTAFMDKTGWGGALLNITAQPTD